MAITLIYKGQQALFGETLGTLTRIDARNIWWLPDEGDTEIMFSMRGDGEWRAFPGPVNARGLELLDAVDPEVRCRNGHVRTAYNTRRVRGRTRVHKKQTSWLRCTDCERAKTVRRAERKKKELTFA